MRTRALALVLSFALAITTGACSAGALQSPSTPAKRAQQQPSSADQLHETVPGQFILQDDTPVKLRLNRNVSSADATVGESVDFEVLEKVNVNGIAVIPKSSTAIGTEVPNNSRPFMPSRIASVIPSV